MPREVVVIHDDFDEMAEFGRENRSPTVPRAEKMTAWEALSKGKTLGKRIGIIIVSGGGLGSAGNNMFQVDAPSDDAAMPLSILLSPPKFTLIPGLVGQSRPSPDLSGADYVKNKTGVTVADPFVRIEWGIGGVSNEVDVDIHQGAMLTVNASFVRISAFISDPAFATVTDGGYELSAFIGPGRDKGLGGQRTIQSPNLPAINVESTAFAVPNFAREVRVTGIDNPPTGGFVATIQFYRDFAGAVPVAQYMFASNGPGFMPVPLGAYYCKLTPLVAAYSQMAAVFKLAI